MRQPLSYTAVLPFACALLAAQPTPDFRATGKVVFTPIAVSDAKGQPVHGLQAADFLLYDNSVLRTIQLEEEFLPLALAVVVQNNIPVGKAIQKIQKTASIIPPLVAGDRGSVALITYSHSPFLALPPTSDANAIVSAFRGIELIGNGKAMLDAVAMGMDVLVAQSPRRRRVLLILGETRDEGSAAKIEDVVVRAQREKVTIYAATYSSAWIQYTGKPYRDRKGDPPPPTGGGMNLFALLQLAAPKAAEELANQSGGGHYSFLVQSKLEEVLQRISSDLHLQYLASFVPADGARGFRPIRVAIKGRPELNVRARTGYWALDDALPEAPRTRSR
ncbi:MAG: VWA domain-containing protein [Bryobacterales bacterium]|nr:VWA domain-containing protein [Bryobacterales bacterium]